MRVFIASVVAAIVIAVAGWYGLNKMQEPAAVAYATDSVRLPSDAVKL